MTVTTRQHPHTIPPSLALRRSDGGTPSRPPQHVARPPAPLALAERPPHPLDGPVVLPADAVVLARRQDLVGAAGGIGLVIVPGAAAEHRVGLVEERLVPPAMHQEHVARLARRSMKGTSRLPTFATLRKVSWRGCYPRPMCQLPRLSIRQLRDKECGECGMPNSAPFFPSVSRFGKARLTDLDGVYTI